MSQKSREGFIWLIRGANERTLPECTRLIQDMAGSEAVHVINERPFTKALVTGYDIAEDSSAEWMVSIDGDVLLERNALFRLRETAERAAEEVAVVQGLTLDKFIPIIRSAGNSLFRCRYASRAKRLVPTGQNPLRPESIVIEGLLRQGLRFYRTNIVVGIHDFEQDYSSIYRKGYLHAKKHANVMDRVMQYWADNQDDDDFRIALAAARASVAHDNDVPVDRNFKRGEAADVMFLLDLEEKGPLPRGEYDLDRVRRLLADMPTDPLIQQKKFPEYDSNYYLKPPPYKKEDREGIIRSLGTRLRRQGEKLRRHAFLMD